MATGQAQPGAGPYLPPRAPKGRKKKKKSSIYSGLEPAADRSGICISLKLASWRTCVAQHKPSLACGLQVTAHTLGWYSTDAEGQAILRAARTLPPSELRQIAASLEQSKRDNTLQTYEVPLGKFVVSIEYC